MKSLAPAALLVILACVLCFSAGYAVRKCPACPKAQVEPLASVYVFGRAVDANGGLLAGVTAELGNQHSTTNESGQWGVDLQGPVAGKTYLLYVFPTVNKIVSAPAGTTLQSGNVLRFTVPKAIPDMLGPFVLEMRPLEPTWTPWPTETPTPRPTVTATEWYVTHTATVTPSVTAPMPPTETPTPGLAVLDIPEAARHLIARAVYESYWQQERIDPYDDFIYTPFWAWTQVQGQWGLPMTKPIYVTVNGTTYVALGFICEVTVMVEGDATRFAVLDYAGNRLSVPGKVTP